MPCKAAALFHVPDKDESAFLQTARNINLPTNWDASRPRPFWDLSRLYAARWKNCFSSIHVLFFDRLRSARFRIDMFQMKTHHVSLAFKKDQWCRHVCFGILSYRAPGYCCSHVLEKTIKNLAGLWSGVEPFHQDCGLSARTEKNACRRANSFSSGVSCTAAKDLLISLKKKVRPQLYLMQETYIGSPKVLHTDTWSATNTWESSWTDNMLTGLLLYHGFRCQRWLSGGRHLGCTDTFGKKQQCSTFLLCPVHFRYPCRLGLSHRATEAAHVQHFRGQKSQWTYA